MLFSTWDVRLRVCVESLLGISQKQAVDTLGVQPGSCLNGILPTNAFHCSAVEAIVLFGIL